MKKFCLFFIAIVIGILGVRVLTSSVLAQATGSAQVSKITFPLNIAGVGTCQNKGQCRQLCDDPVNRDACVSWAKTQGFYKQDSLSTGGAQVIALAKSKLGCDSADSCRQFCEIGANYAACSDFARSAGLQGGYSVPLKDDDKKALVDYVGTPSVKIGGQSCDSLSCVKQTCDKIGNIDECTALAQKAGLRGGVLKIGPGGCTTANTCQKFCNDPTKSDSCTSFGFKGPGGCDSQSSCVDYCKKNSGKCSFYKDSFFNLEEPKAKIDTSAIGKVCAEISQIRVTNGLSKEQLMQMCVEYMKIKAERSLNTFPRPAPSPLLGPLGQSPFPGTIYSPSGGAIYTNLNPGSTLRSPSPAPSPVTNSTSASTSGFGDKSSPSPTPNTTTTSGSGFSGSGSFGGSTSNYPSPTPVTNTITPNTTTTLIPSPTPTTAVKGVRTVAGFFQTIFALLFGF